MNLAGYVDDLRRELTAAADPGGDDARALAERLLPALESAVRLTLLDALSVAADEITRELAPGSVHLRLRGREPDFVVTRAASEPGREAPDRDSLAPSGGPGGAEYGATSRINFRPPESVKARIEEAAGREGLSVNAWLVRVATAALDADDRRRHQSPRTTTGRLSGWVG